LVSNHEQRRVNSKSILPKNITQTISRFWTYISPLLLLHKWNLATILQRTVACGVPHSWFPADCFTTDANFPVVLSLAGPRWSLGGVSFCQRGKNSPPGFMMRPSSVMLIKLVLFLASCPWLPPIGAITKGGIAKTAGADVGAIPRIAVSAGGAADSSPRRKPWVKRIQLNQAPDGAKEDFRWLAFCRPRRGFGGFDDDTHGFTVGYYLPRLRRWKNYFPRLVRKSFSSRAKARAQAAGFCSVEPVARINRRTAPTLHRGEVMFADGFRQSFAGVRVRALPFFNGA
jgi:hypothetical protein